MIRRMWIALIAGIAFVGGLWGISVAQFLFSIDEPLLGWCVSGLALVGISAGGLPLVMTAIKVGGRFLQIFFTWLWGKLRQVLNKSVHAYKIRKVGQEAGKSGAASLSDVDAGELWYWLVDGEVQGPVSERVIATWFESEMLSPQTLMWKESAGDWKPASAIPALARWMPASHESEERSRIGTALSPKREEDSLNFPSADISPAAPVSGSDRASGAEEAVSLPASSYGIPPPLPFGDADDSEYVVVPPPLPKHSNFPFAFEENEDSVELDKGKDKKSED